MIRGGRRGLYSSQKKQDDNDHQDQSQSAGRIVAPSLAVRPSRQRTDQDEDQDYEKYGPE